MIGSNSFATCRAGIRSGGRGSEEKSRLSGKLHLRPYFGHFSGLWITFEIKKKLDSAGNRKIKVKIDECHSPSPYLHLKCDKDLTQVMLQRTLKETCIKYVHKSEIPNIVLERNPQSLSFLCEKTILLNLNEINPSILPSATFSHLDPSTFSTQDLFIKVWHGSSSHPTKMERMKVKQGILISELQWMLCSKLPVRTDPSNLELYEYSSTEKLSENSYLKPNQVTLHCIVSSLSAIRDSVVVSLVGQGIEEIKVEPSMTLNDFQAKIKEKFCLHSSSFAYFPSICRNRSVTKLNQITMSTILDKSTIALINSTRRNLPIVDGIPLNMLKLGQLEMYKLSVSDVNVQMLGSHLIHVYEVTGPTIPISFRTSSRVGKGEYHALISDRTHAVSVNPAWSVQTLLQYLAEISHFPCENISYRGSILSHDVLLRNYFTDFHFKIKFSHSNQEVEFFDDVPKVVNSY